MAWSWKDKKLTKDADLKKLSRNSMAYVVLALAVGAMTFFGVCSPGGPEMVGPTGAAATVGGEEISSLEFRRAYQNTYSQYQKQYADAFDPAMFQLSKMVLNQLVDQAMLYEEALKNGFYSTNLEVEAILADIDLFKDEKGRFSGERFDNFLRSNRYTEESFSEEVRRSLTTQKFRRFLTDTYHTSQKAWEWQYRISETKLQVEYLAFKPSMAKVTVTGDEVAKFLAGDGMKKVEEYYSSHKRDYQKEKKVKASHILVAFEGARNASGDAAKRKKEEAKQKAETILAEVKAAGADFATLAGKYTDDPSGKNKGGDLGFFGKDAMVKEFGDVAFAMTKGETSNIVESPFGFHIIKVFDITEPVNTSLEQAKSEIAQKLLEQEKQPEVLNDMITKTMNAVREGDAIANPVLARYGLKWETTEKFPLNAPSVAPFGSDAASKQAILSLSSSNRLHKEPLKIGENQYIVRFKAREDADISKLTPKEKEDLVRRNRFSESYALFSLLTDVVKKQYNDQGKIWLNEEYLQLDSRNRNEGS